MAPAHLPCSRLSATHRALVSRCTEERRQALRSRRSNGDSRFEAVDPCAERRRRVRVNKRAQRARARQVPSASTAASSTRKRGRTTPPSTAPDQDRHIPALCCGRRPTRCTCFTQGRGAEIARSLQKKCLLSVIAGTQTSRLQTWRDTADMPHFAKQVSAMPLRRLFPIAFAWRHYSNPHFWQALNLAGALPQGRAPAWHVWLLVMRQWQAERHQISGGLFY